MGPMAERRIRSGHKFGPAAVSARHPNKRVRLVSPLSTITTHIHISGAKSNILTTLTAAWPDAVDKSLICFISTSLEQFVHSEPSRILHHTINSRSQNCLAHPRDIPRHFFRFTYPTSPLFPPLCSSTSLENGRKVDTRWREKVHGRRRNRIAWRQTTPVRSTSLSCPPRRRHTNSTSLAAQ